MYLVYLVLHLVWCVDNKIIIKVCNENPIFLFHITYQMASTSEHTLRL